MGIGFSLIGLVLIVTGAMNTYAALGTQLTKDFTGPGNFLFWIAALGMVGVLGYIPAFKQFSTWFMALILLALFLANRRGTSFFQQLSTALAQGPSSGVTAPQQSTPGAPASAAPASSGQNPSGQGYLLNSPITFGPLGNINPQIVWLPSISNFFSGQSTPGSAGPATTGISP